LFRFRDTVLLRQSSWRHGATIDEGENPMLGSPGRARATAAPLTVLFGFAVVLLAPAAASASIPQTSCFWSDRVASKFDTSAAGNYAFPDSGAVYWTARIAMPAGSRIVFKGRYVHARYQSLNTYDGTTNSPTDALNDVATRPDRGSTNPFVRGARRDGKRRAYTITMRNEPAPSERAENTLYAGVPGQSEQQVIYRVYEPDSFTPKDLTGGVGLPVPTLHLPDGTRRTGQAACAALQAKSGRLPVTTVPRGVYDALRSPVGAPITFPADRRPAFRTYYNTGFIVSCWYQLKCAGSPARTGGQYSNIDNQYVGAFVNRGFADGPVLVLKGKLPTTPETGRGVQRMRGGQLRYWSICQNESLYTTKGAGCLYDAQVPVDERGNYTIVTSRAVDRPRNATATCGVGFLPWPRDGDGAGHRDDGFLILRNMLPAAGFHRAVQDTKTPGDEAKVMGPYLPGGTYTTKAKFQKRGC
jgi:hypothetical protein